MPNEMFTFFVRLGYVFLGRSRLYTGNVLSRG